LQYWASWEDLYGLLVALNSQISVDSVGDELLAFLIYLAFDWVSQTISSFRAFEFGWGRREECF
jgi:hypothetical protein